MKEPIRILQWGMTSNYGGIEMFIMNIYRHVDREKVQFDFLLGPNDPPVAFEDEILSMGGRIFRVMYPEREKPLTAGYRLRKFLKEHPEIKGVHVHANFPYAFPVAQAKKCGIPLRIIHSHNSDGKSSNGLKNKLRNLRVEKDILKAPTHRFACSNLAGDWMFGGTNYIWIKNAIDTQKYAFSEKDRQRIRQLMHIEQNTVIGFAGRVDEQKNPQMVIKVFREIRKRKQNAVLLFIGKGKEEDEIKSLTQKCGLSDFVRFLGMRNDVNELYQAMDLFLLPSRFEGFGIVLVEAQCAGLPCLASADVIPPQVKLTNLLEFVSLNESAEKWAEHALHKLAETKRRDRSKEVADAGFEIRQMAKEMEAFYLEQVEKAK